MVRKVVKARDGKKRRKKTEREKEEGEKEGRGEVGERDKSKGILDRLLAGGRSEWQTSARFASSLGLLRLLSSVAGVWGRYDPRKGARMARKEMYR
jgi:hypothetical protein